MIRERSEMLLRMLAVSVISTMKVDSLKRDYPMHQHG
jgi:hypothetical protein